ncbi:MAG: DUF3488 and DUF4129 domain-containing transglutaminase family protein [Tepidisphaerales bacterium]
MYDSRHFKPSLYLVLLLGLSGFALGADAPGLWLFSITAALLNAWLVFTGRFKPLPRWLSSIVSVVAMVGVAVLALGDLGQPRTILVHIGEFLVLIELIKLYEMRANRDYAQLVVVSVLLMVAASVMTASFLFGLLFVIYLVITFYCCLLFHLKVETDRARESLAIPENKLSPLTLKQDQRFLLRSMRRVTGLVAVFAGAAGAAVFVLFPRGPGGGMLSQLQLKADTAMVGFSDRVSFDQIRRIQQSEDTVAHVKVWRNGRLVQGTTALYFRGVTLDTYGLDPVRAVPRPQWSRSKLREESYDLYEDLVPHGVLQPAGAEQWEQQVMMEPSGSRYLFALPGLMYYAQEQTRTIAVRPSRKVSMHYQLLDDTMSLTDPLAQQLEYDVLSTNGPQAEDFQQNGSRPSVSNRNVLGQVRQYAVDKGLIPDVTVPGQEAIPPEEFEAVARRVEHHLRTQFRYTLDLRDSRAQFADIDPVVAFLTRVKKGHCEYFASAMTLICQSAGIPARYVAGFRVDGDAYNPIGGYYLVKESQAHAWVEVLTPRGWVTFDPTSGREAAPSARASLWQALRDVVDYIEYQWAAHVVTYDNKERDKILQWLGELDGRLMSQVYRCTGWVKYLRDIRDLTFLKNPVFEMLLFRAMLFLTSFGAMSLLGLAFYLLYRRRQLRRRAVRIGLEGLPPGRQVSLARQLEFYDRLLNLLEHRGLRRPATLTPREYADSLVYLPAAAYAAVRRLTEMLYRIRFGAVTLTSARRRHLLAAVDGLDEVLPRARRG